MAAGGRFCGNFRGGRDFAGPQARCGDRCTVGEFGGTQLRRQIRSSRPKKTPAPASQGNTSTPSMENVNAAVATSLEYLKDQLFRLELRHQAGTIPDEEYASERARAEKVLRDLVRG